MRENNVTEFKRVLKRGEIRMVYFNENNKDGSSKQSGWRPAIIVGNKKGMEHSTLFRCIPITSKLKKLYMPTHVVLTSGELREQSMALVEAEEPIDERDIKNKIGELSQEDMNKIDAAICISEGLHENPYVLEFLINYKNLQNKQNDRKYTFA